MQDAWAVTADVSAAPRGNASSLRLSNLLQVLNVLRVKPIASRNELTQATRLATQTVHRLVDELVSMGLVAPAIADIPQSRGRPTTHFRFQDERALLTGIDVGSESTRIALATLTGSIVATTQLRTTELHDDLSASLAQAVEDLLEKHGHNRELVAAGVGVPSVVDDAGTLVQPWLAHGWANLPLREELEARLGCSASVHQDNHLAVLAEGSKYGTAPGADPLVVVELGIGVGAGMTIGGRLVTGAHGRLGRLMNWPTPAPFHEAIAGSTLGESLVATGLIRQYQGRQGRGDIFTGSQLFAAAQDGDEVALEVVQWAAKTLHTTLSQLALFADPEVIVVGGGLGRGLVASLTTRDVFAEPGFLTQIEASRLGTDAVVIGGVLAAMQHVEAWLLAQL